MFLGRGCTSGARPHPNFFDFFVFLPEKNCQKYSVQVPCIGFRPSMGNPGSASASSEKLDYWSHPKGKICPPGV